MLYNIYFVMTFITGDSSDWLIEVILYIYLLVYHLSLVIPVIGFEIHGGRHLFIGMFRLVPYVPQVILVIGLPMRFL